MKGPHFETLQATVSGFRFQKSESMFPSPRRSPPDPPDPPVGHGAGSVKYNTATDNRMQLQLSTVLNADRRLIRNI